MYRRSSRYILVLLGSLLLAACGGGDGSDSGPGPDPDPDPDPDPTLPQASIDAPAMAEGDSGTAAMVFTVTLSEAAPAAASLHYATQDDTATAGEDYTAAEGTLSFAAGESSKTISVDIIGDTVDENDEQFVLLLDEPSGLTLATSSVRGTIEDDDTAPGSGLAERPSNATCLAGDPPTTVTGIATEPAFPDLPELEEATALVQAPGDTGHWYVLEKEGRVLRFTNSPGASGFELVANIESRVFSDSSESGLLGIAFHPDFAANGEVYLSYTANSSSSASESRISRFTSPDDGATLDTGSEEVLLTLDQPFTNHNGGNIAFGPGGYLYIGFGDGGSSRDPGDRAQNTRNLFGSILRIDVDNGSPYSTPADNPFAMNALCNDGTGAISCPEIYAWGFRNPWRWSFDAATGELWVGDVGQGDWEEVDMVELGGNYGWRCREGAHEHDTSGVCPPNLIDPVIEYENDEEGISVTGGYVYRGSDIPELVGRYVFGDLNGKIFADTLAGGGAQKYEVLLSTGGAIVSFAEDADGELLYIDYAGGDIRRIVPAGGSSSGGPATLLSNTGCVDPSDPTLPAPGLIPYEPIVGFWSDGADKERWYALPDAGTVDVAADGDWLFPIGSVLVKNFRLAGELVETRLFMRHSDGDWAGYTYEWNEAGTEAVRVIGGKVRDVGGQSWVYPSESDCMLCHTAAAGYTLGLEHAQLNSTMTYPSTGIAANQLVTADAIDVLSAPLPDTPDALPRLPGASAGLEDRARAYLHANCANCHRPGTAVPSDMDLRFATDFAETDTCNVVPQDDLGIPDARIVAPGDAVRSVLAVRPDRRDSTGMPPLASTVVDGAGVQLLVDWIESLGACP